MNKHVLYNTFSNLHFDRLIRRFHRTPTVLFYHGVANNPDSIIETESISEAEFIRQIVYLKRFYHVLSVKEFEERYLQEKWEGNEILLTFDDGYKNILTTALPIFEEYKIPFVLFLTTNNISNNCLFPTTVNRLVVLASSLKRLKMSTCRIDTDLTADNRNMVVEKISHELKTCSLQEVDMIVNELLSVVSKDEIETLRVRYPSVNPLSWDEAKTVAESPLCTIGSHGLDHICCHSSQDIDEVSRQLNDSKMVIEQRLGVSCDYFSYPNGSFTEQSNHIVERAGYRLGFSTRRLPVNALTQWNIPRFYVPYDYSRFVYSLTTYPR